MTPDINVLVAASRSDHAHHAAARAWLLEAAARSEAGQPLRLLPMVLAGFLRLVTNPKIFVQPTPIADAISFIDALLAVRGVELSGGNNEWPALRTLCIDKKLSANAIPDAWLAASVMRLNEHLVTFDKDFKKLLKRSQVTVLAA